MIKDTTDRVEYSQKFMSSIITVFKIERKFGWLSIFAKTILVSNQVSPFPKVVDPKDKGNLDLTREQ